MTPIAELLRSACFSQGAPSLAQSPPDDGLEIAFAGRSNAGKSSAINTITGRRALARTSRTPGRTQQLNFFTLPDPVDRGNGIARRLVDLPGYGYVKIPQSVRRQLEQTLNDYLGGRHSLRGLILVVDIRRSLTTGDQQVLDWCRQAQMPVHILLTKADKLKRGQATAALLQVEKSLAENWPLATVQLFSSRKQQGRETAQAQIAEWLGVPE